MTQSESPPAVYVYPDREVDAQLKRFIDGVSALEIVLRDPGGRLGFETSSKGSDLVAWIVRDSFIWDNSAKRFVPVEQDNALRIVWKHTRPRAFVVRAPDHELAKQLHPSSEQQTGSRGGSLIAPSVPADRPSLVLPESPDERWQLLARLLPGCVGVAIFRFSDFGLSCTHVSLRTDFPGQLLHYTGSHDIELRQVATAREVPAH